MSTASMDLFSVEPDRARAEVVSRPIDVRLRESFEHLFAVAGSRLGDTREIADWLASGVPLRGMAHVVHAQLLSALELGDEYLLARVADAIAQWPGEHGSLTVTSLFGGDRPYVLDTLYFDVCDEGSRRTYGQFLDAGPLSDDERLVSKPALQKAVRRWARVDPDGYAEASALISELILVHSDTSNAGSSAAALGLVRISHLKPGQGWSRYFEALAHEAGHQILNLLLSADPMIENDQERLYGSPLRQEQRPLTAILHAGFVLARTLRAIRRLEADSLYDPATDEVVTAYNNARNEAGFAAKFEDCRATLAAHARFTGQGQRFFDALPGLAYDA